MPPDQNLKLLFISPYLPHPLCGHGAGVFIYGMITRLMERHDVTLISFCDKKEMTLAADYADLPIQTSFIPRGKGAGKSIFWNVRLAIIRTLQLIRSVLLWQPYYVSKFYHPRMAKRIRETTRNERYDVVQIEFTQMAQYVTVVQAGVTLLHELDVSIRPAHRKVKHATSLPVKLLSYVEWCRWIRYEPRIARRFDQVLTVTEQDKHLIRRLSGSDHISYFPHAFEAVTKVVSYSTRKPHTILFFGTYSHQPNVDAAQWLCKEIFPLVQERYKDSRLFIVGTNPPESLSKFAQRNSGIQVTGFVEDLSPYLRETAVFVAPLRFGGGVKNKTLVAMAYGMPVVSTKVGIEGIDGLEHDVVLVGENARQLADHIGYIFDHADVAEKIGKAGCEIVRKHYSWETIIRILLEEYGRVLDRKHA